MTKKVFHLAFGHVALRLETSGWRRADGHRGRLLARRPRALDGRSHEALATPVR